MSGIGAGLMTAGVGASTGAGAVAGVIATAGVVGGAGVGALAGAVMGSVIGAVVGAVVGVGGSAHENAVTTSSAASHCHLPLYATICLTQTTVSFNVGPSRL